MRQVPTIPAPAPQPEATERKPSAPRLSEAIPRAVPVRRRFRAQSVLAVTAIGLVAGLGMALLIGRTMETPPAVVSMPSSPTVAVSARAAPRPTVEAPAKAAPITASAAHETSRARVEESPDAAEVPVSSAATVSSCREMLGGAFVEKTDPEAALAQTELGNRELVRGKVHESQAAFCKAVLFDGAKVERWLNLAQLFLIRRDAKKAVETAERALELEPKNARALEILGDASASLGKLQQARKAYLASERRSEPDTATLKWLVRRDLDEAQRSAKARDFVRAERLFRRVVVFEPEHVLATAGVASCLRRLGEAAAAEAWTRRTETLVQSAHKNSAE